jgi:hypothetical protein
MDGRDASRIENALIQAAQLLAATSERLAQAENTTQAESAKIQTRLNLADRSHGSRWISTSVSDWLVVLRMVATTQRS